MKKKDDPRHKAREKTIKALFARSFESIGPIEDTQAVLVEERKEEIDKKISQFAPAWPIEQIAPVDLAILRLAIWELLFKNKKEPYKVVIDEAVELGKEYGSESSPSFINGVLGTIMKKLN